MAGAAGTGPLFIKRDDCTGLALGGNKARQLEFYLGEAQAEGADTVLITGAVQSNFVRTAAAAARKCGMDIHIQLEERVPNVDAIYRESGNVLLDKLLGATLHSYPHGEDEEGADRKLGEIADELRGEGRRPYIVPLAPGHKPIGALGYVVAAREILQQLDESGIGIDEVVVPSGSGATHAGLLFGIRALGSSLPVLGICVRRPADAQLPRLKTRCEEIAQLLEIPNPVAENDIRVADDFLAPGYGQMNDGALEAINLSARHEGLILDPVYTGRAMAGCLKRGRELGDNKTLLLIHTGGQPAIFGYATKLAPILSQAPVVAS